VATGQPFEDEYRVGDNGMIAGLPCAPSRPSVRQAMSSDYAA